MIVPRLMGWFQRKSVPDPLLGQILESVRDLGNRLVAVETRLSTRESPQPVVHTDSSLHELVSLALKTSLESAKTRLEATERFAERQERRALNDPALALSRAGVDARNRKRREREEAARKEAEPQINAAIAAAKADCEECAAALEHRAAAHTSDLMKHRNQRHEMLVLPLVMNGNGATSNSSN